MHSDLSWRLATRSRCWTLHTSYVVCVLNDNDHHPMVRFIHPPWRAQSKQAPWGPYIHDPRRRVMHV